jgi:hypothetical protein
MSPILGAAGGLSARAYGFTSSVKPVVSGGTLSSDATYFYRTFTGSGALVVTNAPLVCDYLVVAGGGSGGTGAGGGGAGGLRSSTGVTLLPNSYNAVVGAGGPNGNGGSPANGNASSFNSLNTSGGGRGAVYSSAANAGGSGGGGRGWIVTQSPGAGNSGGYSPVEGFAGTATSVRGGGGGGGANSVGGSGSGDFGGIGAEGSNAFSAWASATGTGRFGYYAGGGAGGTIEAVATPRGGYGGGGQGNYLTTSLQSAPLFRDGGFTYYWSDAYPNTGGGGGGGGGAQWTTGPGADGNNYDGSGGAGGSGVVIVRYLKSAVA